MVKIKPTQKKPAPEKPKLTVDPAILGYFNNLRSEDQNEKIESGEKLVEHLTKPEHQNAAKYSIKRFIRGLGSSTNSSRTGFYAAFASYLSVATDVTVAELLDVLAAENLSNHNEEQKLFETYMGNILTCGSIIRSPLMAAASVQEVEALVDLLQKAAESKKVLIPYAKAFLADLIEKVNTDTFAAVVWPRIAAEVNVQPDKQNLNTAHCLMVARSSHPTVVTGKVLKESLKTPTFLHPDNFDWLVRLLWSLKSEIKANHSFYEFFGKQLAGSRHLAAFWAGAFEQRLGEQHKFNELLALKLTIAILQNLSEENQATFEPLTPNFTKVVLAHLKKVANANDNLHPLYEEFFKLFMQHCAQSEAKAQVVETLFGEDVPVLEHKTLYNAVYTTMVAAMDEAQLKGICGTLKKVLTGKADEESAKSRKLGALNLVKRILAHKLVVNDVNLRLEFLKCLADASIFSKTAKKSILMREKGLNVEQNLKLAFYSLLELKLPRLSDELDLLTTLVKYCDERLKKASVLDEETLPVWTKVTKKLSKAKQPPPDGKINLNAVVFEILLLHMGLQLFNNPALARSSIVELESVMERVAAKKRPKKKGKADDGEPEWIEVIVDLFLSLLSHDSSLLRSLTAHIFPRLSKHVTPTAFNQILTVLDLKENPLIAIEKDEDIAEIEDSEDDDSEDGEGGDAPDAGDSDNDDFLDESDVEMEENGDEGNITDRVRSVIHAALGTAGAETDTESLDLDDLDEAEGKRVDDALAAAFKLLKTARKTKPTKTDRENELQLNHFRMRVFDLIESYLKSSPSMACCLELMMFIYEQLPLAIKEPEKFKAVLKKFHYVFDSLTKIKAFDNCADVTQAQLAQLLSDLFEKVAKGAAFPERTSCLSNSALFIIQCSKILAKTNDADKNVMRDIFTASLKEFFTQRQPTLALNMLEIIFKLPWLVLWDLCDVITENGLSLATRNLRRCNSLQLLTLIFKNIRLIQTDLEVATKKLPAIETSLNGYMAGLQTLDQIGENEFNELLRLFVAVFDFHKRYAQVKNKLNVDQCKAVVEKFRPSIVLKAQETNVYTRLCATLQIKPCLNKQLNGETKKTNGVEAGGGKKAQKRAKKGMQKQTDKATKKAKLTNGAESNGDGAKTQEKRKQKVDNKKAKRMKKEERLKASAEGLIENFSFAV